MSYRAHSECIASTYSLAIGIVGKQMDDLWENGNWKVVACDARPMLSTAGDPLAWRWEIVVEWLGVSK